MATALLQPTKKLFLFVGIMDSFDGRKLQALTPDEDGYFSGVPLSVFNEKSLNGCYYDTDSYYRHLTDLNSVFNIKLRHGNLYGEWGHPKDDKDLQRICSIDRDQESHHFKAVYTAKNPAAGKPPIIYGDLKPSGPKGQYLQASLMNKHENSAFSLRCIMTEQYDATLRAGVRTVEEFITYDSVDMPGYLYGSKWYVEATATGKECLVPITLNMLFTPEGKRVGLESFTDRRLLELFGMKDFDLNGKPLGSYIQGTNTYRDTSGVNRSLLHKALLEKTL